MPTSEEKMLIATDEDEVLEQELPIIQDRADEEKIEDHYRSTRTLRHTVRWQRVAILSLSGALAYYMPRHVVHHYVQASATGIFQHVNLNDTAYRGRPIEAREYLKKWAMFRYRRLKTGGKGSDSIHEFAKSHLFYAANKENDLVHIMQQEDAKRGLISKVVSGELPEQDLDEPVVVLESWGPHPYNGKSYYGGRAVINLSIHQGATSTEKPKEIKMVVALDYYLNPDQVDEKSSGDPQYADVNGAGLTIVTKPLEQTLSVQWLGAK